MIKATLHTDKGTIALIGLTKENVNFIQSGKPMPLDLREMGLNDRVLVVYGETDTSILQQLRAEGFLSSDIIFGDTTKASKDE